MGEKEKNNENWVLNSILITVIQGCSGNRSGSTWLSKFHQAFYEHYQPFKAFIIATNFAISINHFLHKIELEKKRRNKIHDWFFFFLGDKLVTDLL